MRKRVEQKARQKKKLFHMYSAQISQTYSLTHQDTVHIYHPGYMYREYNDLYTLKDLGQNFLNINKQNAETGDSFSIQRKLIISPFFLTC